MQPEAIYQAKQLEQMLKFFLIIFTIIAALASCSNLLGDQKTTLIKDSPNNNQTKKAVLLQNDGNATTGLSLHVSILDYDHKLSGNEIGNTFTVDSNHNTTMLDSTSVKLSWISNDTLQINYDNDLRTFKQEKKVNNVTVIYIAD